MSPCVKFITPPSSPAIEDSPSPGEATLTDRVCTTIPAGGGCPACGRRTPLLCPRRRRAGHSARRGRVPSDPRGRSEVPATFRVWGRTSHRARLSSSSRWPEGIPGTRALLVSPAPPCFRMSPRKLLGVKEETRKSLDASALANSLQNYLSSS